MHQIQVAGRTLDVAFTRAAYDSRIYPLVDYLTQIGSYEFYPVSGKLQEKSNFLTLTDPFDKYIWIFLVATVFALIWTLVLIEKIYLEKMRIPSKDILRRSKIN